MSSNSLLFRRVRTLMFALTALPLVSHAAVETIAPGKLTYGTAATFMPFEFVKEGIQRAYPSAAGETSRYHQLRHVRQSYPCRAGRLRAISENRQPRGGEQR